MAILKPIKPLENGAGTQIYPLTHASQVVCGEGEHKRRLEQDGKIDADKLNGKDAVYYLGARNLLDNSNFKDAINQRGASGTYPAWGGYTIDRWQVYASETTITPSNDGLKLLGRLHQIVKPYANWAFGKKLTFAAKIDGTVYVCSGTASSTTEYSEIANIDTSFGRLQIAGQSGHVMVIITGTAKEILVEWAALYEGTYTADNLPPYIPKGYAAELAECQRYYMRSWIDATLEEAKANDRGWVALRAITQWGCQVGITLPSTMRTIPTVKIYAAKDLTEGAASSWETATIVPAHASKVTNRQFAINRMSDNSPFVEGNHYQFYYEANADL